MSMTEKELAQCGDLIRTISNVCDAARESFDPEDMIVATRMEKIDPVMLVEDIRWLADEIEKGREPHGQARQ
jgi:hypothetical protein